MPVHVFFHTPATPQTYPLSLHDALPIFARSKSRNRPAAIVMPLRDVPGTIASACATPIHIVSIKDSVPMRSEEHTSELQSRQYLVCRLLLEKKNPYAERSLVVRFEGLSF